MIIIYVVTNLLQQDKGWTFRVRKCYTKKFINCNIHRLDYGINNNISLCNQAFILFFF